MVKSILLGGLFHHANEASAFGELKEIKLIKKSLCQYNEKFCGLPLSRQ